MVGIVPGAWWLVTHDAPPGSRAGAPVAGKDAVWQSGRLAARASYWSGWGMVVVLSGVQKGASCVADNIPFGGLSPVRCCRSHAQAVLSEIRAAAARERGVSASPRDSIAAAASAKRASASASRASASGTLSAVSCGRLVMTVVAGRSRVSPAQSVTTLRPS